MVNKTNRKLNKSKKSKISFEDEIITKENAEKLILEENIISPEITTEKATISPKISKKKRKNSIIQSDNSNDDVKPEKKPKNCETNTDNSDNSVEPVSAKPAPKKESNRSKKREKHAKLLEEQKIKTQLDLQSKVLNYLSKWKYSKSEWKFEKLKQVWLQQNFLDNTKLPEEHWNTTVEYFNGSKGLSRQFVLDEAIKFIENDENIENRTEIYEIKLKRARDIVQNLQ